MPPYPSHLPPTRTAPDPAPAPDLAPAPTAAPVNAVPAPSPRAVLAIVLVTYLMIIVDTSVVITGLPDIRAELGFDATGVSWVQNAYTLAFGGLLLLGARAGDLLGRRRVLVTGLVLFTAASLVVAAAPTAATLVAARAVQGVGAAVLAPATLALITAHFAEGPARRSAVAAYGSVAGVGAAVGLVLGGLLAEQASWRVAFMVNVPLGALLVGLALRHLPAQGRTPGRFDVAGAVVSTAGLTLVVHGIVQLGDLGPTSPAAVVPLVVGVVLMVVFVLVEARATQPLLPLHLFASRVRTGAYLARACFIGAMITYFLFLSQVLQDAQHRTALVAGLCFLPMTLVNFAVATVVTRVVARVGPAASLVAGLALTAVGMVLLTGVDATGGLLVQVAVPGVLVGAGQGLVFAPLTTAGIAGAAAHEAGAASGAVNVFHQIGGALGLGVATTVAASVGGTGTDVAAVLARAHAAFTVSTVLLVVALLLVLALVAPGLRRR